MALRAPLTRAVNRASSTTPAFAVQWRRGNATVAPVTQNAAGSKGPTAMVFMNMGGPSTTDEVHGFLSMLFVRFAAHSPLESFQADHSNNYRLTRT
jgi:ferrochelatase